MTNYKLGCLAALPDHRDFVYKATPPPHFPPSLDLRPSFFSVWDQGQIGSCTAHAIGAQFRYRLIKENLVGWMPSRLQIYYDSRALEGTIASDSGAQMRDVYKTLNLVGTGEEKFWPYDTSKFRQRPNQLVYGSAKHSHHKAVQYHKALNPDVDWKVALMAGLPVAIGFVVYASFFDTGSDGMMKMPASNESQEGGHAVLIVGWNDGNQAWIVRNSWAASWGDQGYFYMPFSFARNSNYVFDAWVLQLV